MLHEFSNNIVASVLKSQHADIICYTKSHSHVVLQVNIHNRTSRSYIVIASYMKSCYEY